MFKKKKLTPEQKKFKNEVMKKNLKNSRASYVMMAPYLLIFLTFTIIPVVVGFALSFTNYDMLQSPKFVGLDNYVNLFLYDAGTFMVNISPVDLPVLPTLA